MTPQSFEEKYKLETITYKFDDLSKILDIIQNNCERRLFDSITINDDSSININNLRDIFVLTGSGGLESIIVNIKTYYGDIVKPIIGNRQYYIPSFGMLYLQHNPQFDNLMYNGVRAPKIYYPASTYTFDVYVYGMHVFRFQLDLDDILNKELEDANTNKELVT